MVTKSFVKQKLQYCERIQLLSHPVFPIQWNGRKRDELYGWKPQQQKFHNYRSGQWQVMYYEGSHFTFWKEFADDREKSLLILPITLICILKTNLQNDKQLTKEFGKKRNISFNRNETNYLDFYWLWSNEDLILSINCYQDETPFRSWWIKRQSNFSTRVFVFEEQITDDLWLHLSMTCQCFILVVQLLWILDGHSTALSVTVVVGGTTHVLMLN